MSYNGSGTFNINSAGQPVVAGTVISATAFNALTADLGVGLSTAITKDGQTTTTARITFAQGVTSSLTTDSSSTSTGSIITAGGVGIAKALFVGTTASIAGAVTLSGGTANQVQYLNGSKVLTGSANMTFDGTTLTSTGFAGPLNGTVGATTANTGAFTTLSASSTVSGTGFSTYLASPPAIGGTVAAAITGTTVTANTQFSGPGTGLTGTASGLSIGGNAATATSATTATNVAGGAANQLPYQTGAGATSFITAPTVASTSLTWNGSAFTWATAGTNVTVSNDTSTASNLYPLFATTTSGTVSSVNTSNAKLLYKPSTGELQASQVVASNGIVVNSATVSTSYSIPVGSNAMSSGPITIASGQSVTVPSGSRWVVL